uniref:RRM domain-containing protein n=1 Tax=Arcella intermedia TaxID=1963864 RepID=A0A6B2LKC2_9EUKA|eukprot:TRINITY_DN110_c0_g2_i1.p1 TRINITY_DN110_c0_g2~~TRINITY_DN110_c0_g2_i1.p1  ORF type:complete len:201 (-),score=28.65 TRINITY_DN110_c0_g2_i1:106-666(-)
MEDKGLDSKVFVGGLLPQTNSEGLKNHFSTFGNVIEAKVVMDKTTGRSKGYGFVTFASPLEAQAAVREGFLIIDGNKCNCNLASLGIKEDAKKRMYTGAGQVYGVPMDGYSLGMDYYSQDLQMQMQSLQSMYSEISTIKYDLNLMNQSINTLKSTVSALKSGIDALVAQPQMPLQYPIQSQRQTYQ